MEDLNQLVRGMLSEMRAPFDTHQLILALAQQNQRAYVNHLNQVQGETPFQTLHSMMGKTIHKLAPEFGLSYSETRSKDIFGNENTCGLWTSQ